MPRLRQKTTSSGRQFLLLGKFLDVFNPSYNRFGFIFPEAHPVPVDGGIGIVDDWYPENRVAFEFGYLWFCGSVVLVGHIVNS